MARNVFIVNATQVVVSESHPEGLLSVMSGFPQYFDSRSYNSTPDNPNGNEETALLMAKSAYHDQLSKNEANTNPNRAMATVTLERADGRMIMWESLGKFPYMEPTREPEEAAE